MSTPFGAAPYGVIQGTDGNLYGTTTVGGANSQGEVFQVSTDGNTFDDLYDFGSSGTDGAQPIGGVIQGSDGGLYGTTQNGGANNLGILFRTTTAGGSITVLHTFGAGSDLSTPRSAPIEAEDGSLFGVAWGGGPNGEGGIYRINLDGTQYTMIHAFTGGANDGGSPYGGLIEGGDGFLYGTTFGGGADDSGIVFKIAPDGSGFQILHNFAGSATDGGFPQDPLVLGNDGNLYGQTDHGGPNSLAPNDSDGALFEVSRDGNTYNVLHIFAGSDGANPGGLVQATNGIFYGMTYTGTGSLLWGTIFGFTNYLQPSPTGLYALDGNAQVQLSWNTDSLADPSAGYNLYRSTTSGGEGNTPYQSNLLSPQFTDTNVTNGAQYFYQVTAYSPDGIETAKSYEVEGAPQMAIASSNGLTASPNPATGGETTTGTLILQTAAASPTTAFVTSDNPNVTVANSYVTVPATDTSTSFPINTLNTGTQYTADITAFENGTEATATITVDVPTILHTFQPGLQMISANTDDTGITLANDFGQQGTPAPKLAVWNGSAYAISPTAPANKIVPGQGYWYHPTGTANLYNIGTDETNSSTVDVSLAQGWNMIGNPFGGSISGDDLAVQNGSNVLSLANANTAGLIGDTFYTWQPTDSAYETQSVSTATLVPYEGYWLYAIQPCTLVLQNLP